MVLIQTQHLVQAFGAVLAQPSPAAPQGSLPWARAG